MAYIGKSFTIYYEKYQGTFWCLKVATILKYLGDNVAGADVADVFGEHDVVDGKKDAVAVSAVGAMRKNGGGSGGEL